MASSGPSRSISGCGMFGGYTSTLTPSRASGLWSLSYFDLEVPAKPWLFQGYRFREPEDPE